MKHVVKILGALLLTLAIQSCQVKQDAQTVAVAADSTALSIAYVNTDTLLLNYEYSQKLSDELISKEESSRAEFNQKYRVFQQDVVEFQRKVQNNGFLSLDRAEKEQARLAKVEQELQELNDRLSAELLNEQARISRELRTIITEFLAEYAKGKYALVLSNNAGDNILYSAPGIDITAQVVEELNKQYREK